MLRHYQVIGLTGTICSGKSSLSRHIVQKSGNYLGYLNLDHITRNMYANDSGFQKRCYRLFGKDRIMNESGTEIDTTKVGQILFNEFSASKRNSFLRVVYIKMIWALFDEILGFFLCEGKRLVIIEAPILFETKFLVPFCYPICTVYVEDSQILAERVRERNDPNLDAKLKRQMSWQEKVKRSDFAIKNEGTLDEAYDTFTVKLLTFEM